MDALQGLDERDADPTNSEHGPVIFQISGQGQPGTDLSTEAGASAPLQWTAHAALHRPKHNDPTRQRAILELEAVEDTFHPLATICSEPIAEDERGGMPKVNGQSGMAPTPEELHESTVSLIKPLRAMAKLRDKRSGSKKAGEVDVVGLLAQINEQLNRADDLKTFLKVCGASEGSMRLGADSFAPVQTVAAVFKDLSDFDRCMVYQ